MMMLLLTLFPCLFRLPHVGADMISSGQSQPLYTVFSGKSSNGNTLWPRGRK